ncbi:hypothetical protein TMatcc_007371 [Talaromyces marneffei ATCC 18224]
MTKGDEFEEAIPEKAKEKRNCDHNDWILHIIPATYLKPNVPSLFRTNSSTFKAKNEDMNDNGS